MSRFLGDDYILPELNRHNTPWFTSGSIQVQVCDDCSSAQHPPDDVCYSCQSFNLSYKEMAGTGVIESCVEVTYPAYPTLVDKVPYTIALVSIDGAPGCRAFGNILNMPTDQVKIGQTVKAVYEDAVDEQGEKLLIPQWEVTE